MDDADQHECTVKAVLDTAQAYAKWTPVTDLAKYGLIQRLVVWNLLKPELFFNVLYHNTKYEALHDRCGSLLHSNIFRLHALRFFKSIMQRYVLLGVFYVLLLYLTCFHLCIFLSKRPVGIAIAEYDLAVSAVSPVLMNILEGSLKFAEPELQCLKALCSSLRCHTINPEIMGKLSELFKSGPATCEVHLDAFICKK